MIVRLAQFGTRLQGKTAGRKHYGKICERLAPVPPGMVAFLDFEGVETVNGSWLNMAISPLFPWSSQSQNDFFPVLSHFPEKDLDELELVAKLNAQSFLIAPDTTEPICSALLVGPLDEGLRLTLEKLIELGGVTGAELARQVPEAGIQATAWNNRLKELHDKRLLVRHRHGRRQIYLPIAMEVEPHGLQLPGSSSEAVEEASGEGDLRNADTQALRTPQ